MAISDYHWKITTAPEIGANGDLNFHEMYVEICTAVTPETWMLLEQGHYTLVMPGATLLELTATGTTAQKIAAVKNWITDQVRLRGLSISDQARRALLLLLPGGVWPALGVIQTFVP